MCESPKNVSDRFQSKKSMCFEQKVKCTSVMIFPCAELIIVPHNVCSPFPPCPFDPDVSPHLMTFYSSSNIHPPEWVPIGLQARGTFLNNANNAMPPVLMEIPTTHRSTLVLHRIAVVVEEITTPEQRQHAQKKPAANHYLK